MVAAALSERVDVDDVQGLVARAYGRLPAASLLLLTFGGAAAARRWVTSIAGSVANCSARSLDVAVQIAFTATGLRAVGLPETVLAGFANEFVEGMTTPFRQRLLGDTEESAPEQWAWGADTTTPIHAVLLLYAIDTAALARAQAAEMQRASAEGVRVVQELDTVDLKGREHFGFHDGVSQPAFRGLPHTADDPAALPTGEFILGYQNAYHLYGERPLLPPSSAATEQLPRDAGGSGGADLGRNGTYVVLRQLRQDVRGFWRFTDSWAGRTRGTSDEAQRTWLASRIVGRWPSGAPLALSPDHDDAALADANDFTYHASDPAGLRCPIGSHIRRANPRDSLDPKPGSTRSLNVNDHHRILRRGREYGAPVDPATLLEDVSDPTDRGLYFLCLNASIRRQFEFVQHTWVNNPQFAGLYHDDDPLIGSHGLGGGTFTVPGAPVRVRVQGVPRFVTVRGGAYLFMPGIRALRYFGSLDGGRR